MRELTYDEYKDYAGCILAGVKSGLPVLSATEKAIIGCELTDKVDLLCTRGNAAGFRKFWKENMVRVTLDVSFWLDYLEVLYKEADKMLRHLDAQGAIDISIPNSEMEQVEHILDELRELRGA